MQRREHEVSGQRGLDGVLRRLGVPDLAHHDDVGILPQHGAKRRREREVDRRTHRHLIELLVHHFDRIFDGHDIQFGFSQVLQH